MVNPGGTGRPALVISARPAPLPPRTSFILPLPSALPPPNEYTYLVAAGLFVVFFSFTSASGRVIVAIDKSFVSSDSNSLKTAEKRYCTAATESAVPQFRRDVAGSVSFRGARGAA